MTTHHEYDPADYAGDVADAMVATVAAAAAQPVISDGAIVVKAAPGQLVTPFSDQIEALLKPYTLNIDQWIEALFDVSEFPDADPDEAALGMLAQILTAQTSQEALSATETLSGRDDLCGGEPGGKSPLLVIHGARPLKSTFDEGADCYCLVDATRKADGAPARFTTGARAVQAVVAAHIANGWMPFEAILEIRRKPTRRGFYPLNLVAGG